MSEKPSLSLDLDGTLCKTNEFFLHLVNYKHGTDYQIRDLKQWASWEDLGMTESDFYEVYDYMNSTGLMAQVPIMDRRIPTWINELQEEYDVDVVTARDKIGSMHGKKWLQNHNIDCPLISVDRQKVDLKLELGYDILVDDCPKYINSAYKYPDKQIIIHACPWNQADFVLENVVRLQDWEDIYNYLTVIDGDV